MILPDETAEPLHDRAGRVVVALQQFGIGLGLHRSGTRRRAGEVAKHDREMPQLGLEIAARFQHHALTRQLRTAVAAVAKAGRIAGVAARTFHGRVATPPANTAAPRLSSAPYTVK